MPENGLAGAAALVTGAGRVQPFLSPPARRSPPTDDLTSSGPPLETVIAELQRLCDLRTARDRPGVTTAHISLDTLSRIVDAG